VELINCKSFPVVYFKDSFNFTSTSIVIVAVCFYYSFASLTNNESNKGGVNWIHLTQGRDKSQAVVSTVRNFWTPESLAVSCPADELLLTFQDSAP
jgi:hypothetical protein